MTEAVKIHPFDVYAMLQDTSKNLVTDLFKYADGTIEIEGVRYEQTTCVPPQSEIGKSMMDHSWIRAAAR